MKKILAMACLLCGGLFWGHAQVADTTVIAIDSIDKNGVRHIVSTDIEIYRLWTTDAAFNLSYADVPGDTTPYRLNIAFNEGKFTMSPGKNKIIFKLKKVKTPMELYDTRLVKLGQNDYVAEETKDGTYYYITPAFAISEAQIRQLAATKVVKFRVVHDHGKFDREDKDNVMPTGIQTAYEAMQQLLAATPAVMNAVVPVEEEAPAVWVVPEEETPAVWVVPEEDTDGEVVSDEAEPSVEAEAETVDKESEEVTETETGTEEGMEESVTGEQAEAMEATEEVMTEDTTEVEAEGVTEETVVEETTEAVTESETMAGEQPAETEVETVAEETTIGEAEGAEAEEAVLETASETETVEASTEE